MRGTSTGADSGQYGCSFHESPNSCALTSLTPPDVYKRQVHKSASHNKILSVKTECFKNVFLTFNVGT